MVSSFGGVKYRARAAASRPSFPKGQWYKLLSAHLGLIFPLLDEDPVSRRGRVVLPLRLRLLHFLDHLLDLSGEKKSVFGSKAAAANEEQQQEAKRKLGASYF